MPIYGTDGNDFFNGESWSESYYGKRGDDLIFGNGGHDYLDGGAGDDYIHGGAGNDIIKPGAGVDGVIIGQGSDTVIFDGYARDSKANAVILDFGCSPSDDTLFFVGDHWFVSAFNVAETGNFAWAVQWVEGWDMANNDYGPLGINIEFAAGDDFWPA